MDTTFTPIIAKNCLITEISKDTDMFGGQLTYSLKAQSAAGVEISVSGWRLNDDQIKAISDSFFYGKPITLTLS